MITEQPDMKMILLGHITPKIIQSKVVITSLILYFMVNDFTFLNIKPKIIQSKVVFANFILYFMSNVFNFPNIEHHSCFSKVRV